MDEVTDTVFRQVVHLCAPADLYFTEFVNVDGLMSAGRSKLLQKLNFSEHEGPLIAQIWGLKPENFESIARQIADGTIAKELGLPDGVNFAGVDLNMGCPAKSEVKNGACSALIKNRPLAKEIIEATKRGLAGRLPISVKTRLGFSAIDMSWIEFLLEADLDMLTIHGRTRKEMSKVPAHWDLVGEAVKIRDKMGKPTKIIGNGDVLTRRQGEVLAREYSLDGIMIGRGVFQDPYVFSTEDTWGNMSPTNKLELLRNHIKLWQATWPAGAKKFEPLKKFCKLYISGFDGAKELREKFMANDNVEDLLAVLGTELSH